MNPSGYSGTPLVKKLGIKPEMRIAILNPPEGYAGSLGPLPTDVQHLTRLGKALDFIHFFTKQRSQLESRFPKLKSSLAYTGMLWLSWPKKAAKVKTDISENIVREIGVANGLVDVKIAAIDEIWSGLKFMYRLEDRPATH